MYGRRRMTKITTVEEFNYFGKIADDMTAEAGRAVRRTIRRIEARWKGSLSGPRTGREYRKSGYKTVIIHRASAPGEAPATDTGNLAASIYSRMTGTTRGEVGSTAECAPVLELGGGKMAPRPSLGPAVRAEWPQFVADMQKLVK